MNNDLLILTLWLTFILIYPYLKKGLQQIILDTTELLMIPIKLILNIVKLIRIKFRKK